MIELILSDVESVFKKFHVEFEFEGEDITAGIAMLEATKTETPVEPADEPEKPGKTEPSEEPVEPDTIRYYFANVPTDVDTEAWEMALQDAVKKRAYMFEVVFHKDKNGKLTGTGYFNLGFSPTIRPDGMIQFLQSKEIGGKKIVITRTKKP